MKIGDRATLVNLSGNTDTGVVESIEQGIATLQCDGYSVRCLAHQLKKEETS